MGLCAQIYLISPDAYLAATRGDIEAFDTDHGLTENLDKAWHAIHFLVTGDQEFRFLLGGQQLDAVSEPAEAHSPESIAVLNQRLADTSPAELMAGFDPGRFNALRIYPGPWDATAASYIEEYLIRFASVVRRAAEQGKGIAVFLS